MHVITDVTIDDGTSLDDEQLLRDVRAGDRSAFDVLYRRHVDWARHTARWHLRSPEAVDDVVSEAFMATLHALQNGRGPHDGFRAYMRTCIRNQCIAHSKHAARSTVEWVDGSEYDRADGPSPDDVVAMSPVAAAFRTLNPRWQQALLLTAVHELEPAEAAERMGLCTNAMNALTFRAREALAMAYVEAHVESAAPGCAQVATKFARYVRGQANARDTEIIETHVATCLSCTQAVAELRDLNQTLRALPFVPACPPIVAVAVGLSWTGKVALIAGLLASASAMTADQPIVDRPTSVRVTVIDTGDEPAGSTGGAPVGEGADVSQPTGSVGTNGTSPAGVPGGGSNMTASPDAAGAEPATPGTPPSRVGVIGETEPHADGTVDSVVDDVGDVATTVDETVASTLPLGGVVDLVSDVTGLDPTAPVVSGTVGIGGDGSGVGASVDVGVVGIDVDADVDVDLDEGTTVTVVLPVTVPNVLPPDATVSIPPLLPSLPLPPLPPPPAVVVTVPPLPPLPSLPLLFGR